jgi:hypothetical protein
MIRRAVAGLGIKNGHLLDTHGLRRGWVSSAREEGIC